jgi:hypothetical protein
MALKRNREYRKLEMAKKARSRSVHLISPPDWIKLKTASTEEQKEAAFKEADYFVHYEIADKAKHTAFHKWAAANWDKETHKKLKKLSDHHFTTYGKMCFIAGKVGYMPESLLEYFTNMKHTWLQLANISVVEKIEAKEVVKKPSIQDHMREQVAPLCEQWDIEFEAVLDGSSNAKSFNPAQDIEIFGAIKGPQAKIIKDEYLKHLEEAQLVAAWKDPEIKEAYSHTTAKQRKAVVAFYEIIINACDAVINTQKSTRKSSKPRKVSKEKVIAKLKFQVNDGKLGIASINPQDTLGQNEVWVYNTKTRKLGVYHAATPDPSKMSRSSISYKGTTMIGFDEEKSVQKTLRKPEEHIKDFKGKAKTKFNKAFKELTTIDTKMNGRFSDSIIILRSF